MEHDVRDALSRALAAPVREAGRQAERPPAVRTALVRSVSGGMASCVLAGDADALTEVALAGHECAAGQTVVTLGQCGRWYAVGVLG